MSLIHSARNLLRRFNIDPAISTPSSRMDPDLNTFSFLKRQLEKGEHSLNNYVVNFFHLQRNGWICFIQVYTF